MTATFKTPLADWRVLSYPSATVQATATQTAGTDSSVSGSAYPRSLVIMNISGNIAAGATAQTPIRLNLIDGTTGGTPIRSWALAAPANQATWQTEDGLNLLCVSGFATIEFAGTSLAATQQSVAMSGYTRSYGDN